MNRLRVLQILLPLLLPAVLCSPPGGSGTETTTGITGAVVNEHGALQAHVQVQLIPESYDPVTDGDVLLTDTTDSAGRYVFLRVDSGSYSVQAVHLEERSRALVRAVRTVADTLVEASTDTLHRPGAVMVALPSGMFNATGYVYIPGTTVFSYVNSCSYFVMLDSAPAGIMPAIILVPESGAAGTALRYNVPVATGDTALVWNAGWTHTRSLILNTSATGADVAGTVTDFPVLIRLNAAVFNFAQGLSDGADIRFARADSINLPCEIERWDVAAKEAEIWVRVDTLYGNDSSQSITMYWGNSTAANSTEGTAVFDTADGFVGVWHMNEDPAAPAAVKDRTPNAHDATSYGSMTATNSVDGPVGRAMSFDGTDDYLNAGNVRVTGHYSIGLWARIDTMRAYHRFLYEDSCFTLWYDQDSVSVRMEHMPAGSWWKGLLQDGGTRVAMTTGVWYFLTATFDGSVIRLYVNGNEQSVSKPVNGGPLAVSKPLLIGGSRPQFTRGALDEIRVEGVARSPDWIRLCYVNQCGNGTLVMFK